MRLDLVIELLLLLTVANATPVVLGFLLGRRLAWPLDAGRNFTDGRRLFGASKTVRGILASILLTALLAPLLGVDRSSGALVGLLAMIGDVTTSFTKRRLGYTSGCASPLLDQLPETCLPLLVLAPATGASPAEMAAAVVAFTALDLLLTHLYLPDQARCR